MTRLILAIMVMISSTTSIAQERWLHVSGVSYHDRSGYNGQNWGIGLEQKIDSRWSAAAGTYHNSLGKTSVYALSKYHWIDQSPWHVSVNFGAISGYETMPVAPVVLPEVCWNWICSLVIPTIGSNQTNAVAVYFRVPI